MMRLQRASASARGAQVVLAARLGSFSGCIGAPRSGGRTVRHAPPPVFVAFADPGAILYHHGNHYVDLQPFHSFIPSSPSRPVGAPPRGAGQSLSSRRRFITQGNDWTKTTTPRAPRRQAATLSSPHRRIAIAAGAVHRRQSKPLLAAHLARIVAHRTRRLGVGASRKIEDLGRGTRS
jgi:hypothetical protein